jgi:site-specific recombinase XerD
MARTEKSGFSDVTSQRAPDHFQGSDPLGANARQVPLSCIESAGPRAALPAPSTERGLDHPLVAMPSQASSDRELVKLWVARSASPHTQRNYRRHASRFFAFIRRPLATVTLRDLQAYFDSLHFAAPASRANATAAVKSLLSFAQEVGYLRFNVGKVVKAPPVKNTLAERIMAEADTLRMIGLESSPRNRALLTVLYGGGLRIAEICGMRLRDLCDRDNGGQVTIYGKGGKTRAVRLSTSTCRLLAELRGEAQSDDPLFRSRLGGPLTQSQVHRIVKAAARRAGLSAEISAHWLRHAHASHALDRGAPIHLVQATLGHASVATTGRYLHARPTESSSRFLGV